MVSKTLETPFSHPSYTIIIFTILILVISPLLKVLQWVSIAFRINLTSLALQLRPIITWPLSVAPPTPHSQPLLYTLLVIYLGKLFVPLFSGCTQIGLFFHTQYLDLYCSFYLEYPLSLLIFPLDILPGELLIMLPSPKLMLPFLWTFLKFVSTPLLTEKGNFYSYF